MMKPTIILKNLYMKIYGRDSVDILEEPELFNNATDEEIRTHIFEQISYALAYLHIYHAGWKYDYQQEEVAGMYKALRVVFGSPTKNTNRTMIGREEMVAIYNILTYEIENFC